MLLSVPFLYPLFPIIFQIHLRRIIKQYLFIILFTYKHIFFSFSSYMIYRMNSSPLNPILVTAANFSERKRIWFVVLRSAFDCSFLWQVFVTKGNRLIVDVRKEVRTKGKLSGLRTDLIFGKNEYVNWFHLASCGQISVPMWFSLFFYFCSFQSVHGPFMDGF